MSFNETIHHLSSHGPMYFQPFNYDSLVAYLSGYDHAMIERGEPSSLLAFKNWLHEKVGHHCSLHWSRVIVDVFACGDRAMAMGKFFVLYKEYEQAL